MRDFLWRYWYAGNRSRLVLALIALAALLVLRFRAVRVWRLALIGGVAVLGCIVVAYMAYMALLFADLPTAVICERQKTEMDADPQGAGVRMRYEQSRLGPCVFYNPERTRTGGGQPNGSVD